MQATANGTPEARGHRRSWPPEVDRAAQALFDGIVASKQTLPPGEVARLWDREILFQLPGGYAELDLGGKLIYWAIRALNLWKLLSLAIHRKRNKVRYEIVDPFVRDPKYRGNPVFGDRCLERHGEGYLTERERCLYNRHGFVDTFALSEDLRRRYDCLLPETVRFSERFGLAYTIAAHLYHKNLLGFALEPEIVRRVSSLLGENVVLLSAHTFTKRPGSPATPYHHGTSYQPVENTLTVFVALTDCKSDNSCLTLVPGSEIFAGREILEAVYQKIELSHLALDLTPPEREQIFLEVAFTLRALQLDLAKFQTHANFSLLSTRIKFLLQNAQARAEIELFRGLQMELEPFEALIFSERNFHGSGPNVSSRVRCALALRYAKGDAFIDDRRHLRNLRSYGPRREPGLAAIFDEFVGDRSNAVLQVVGDPQAARRAGNNVLDAEALMRRISEQVPQ